MFVVHTRSVNINYKLTASKKCSIDVEFFAIDDWRNEPHYPEDWPFPSVEDETIFRKKLQDNVFSSLRGL